MIAQDTSPKEFYEAGKTDRKLYEDRAETYANLTIPSVFRDSSWTSSDTKEDNYCQSFGAMCVKSLVSKIGMSIFPPNASSFKLQSPQQAVDDLSQGDSNVENDIQKDISEGQNKINKHLEGMNIRRTVFRVLEHLTVVSSCVVERVPNKAFKIHSLRNIVVELDDMGEEVAICVYEKLRTLPDGIDIPEEKKKTNGEKYDLYTLLYKDENDSWIMKQSIDDEPVGEEKKFTEKSRPFVYLGWLWNSGDAYYRPYVEDYEGDLSSVDTLTKVLTKGALVSSKSITFVDERGGRTRIRDVKKAANGAILQGNAGDVTSYQHGKNFDFQSPERMLDRLEGRLSYAFLLQQGLRRDAERVTAEEIRMISAELENALASVYAVISNKIIKRFVEWAMEDLKLKFNALEVKIVTGLDALGRAVESQKLDAYIQRGIQFGYVDRIKKGTLATRYADYDNIDTENLLMSDKEYQAEIQKQQQMLALQQGTQAFAGQAGANLANQTTTDEGA